MLASSSSPVLGVAVTSGVMVMVPRVELVVEVVPRVVLFSEEEVLVLSPLAEDTTRLLLEVPVVRVVEKRAVGRGVVVILAEAVVETGTVAGDAGLSLSLVSGRGAGDSRGHCDCCSACRTQAASSSSTWSVSDSGSMSNSCGGREKREIYYTVILCKYSYTFVIIFSFLYIQRCHSRMMKNQEK